MAIVTITAVVRVKPGAEDIMRAAFEHVAAYANEAEPGTLDFYVTQSSAMPTVFTTYERFVDVAAMTAHNDADVVRELHRIAAPILDGMITLEIGHEISAKRS